MTDANGASQTNGAPKPASQRKPMAGPRAGDAKVSPVIPSMADSLEAEFGAEGASSVAKPKSPSSKASSSAAAARKQPAAAKAQAKTDPAALAAKDSVLLAGMDEAAVRAQQVRDWALIRREEARDAVRTHPLGSSVIVFGAGMIFGLLMARR